MNPSFTSVVFAVTILFAISAQHGYAQVNQTPNQIPPANNAFAVDLYKDLIKENENLVCSPLSLSIVLSMLLEGSPETSDTFTQLLNGLKYDKLSLTTIENGYRQLLNSLESNNGYILNLADSVWIKETFKVKESYEQKVVDVFKAEINPLSQTDGAGQINKWVANHTMNKITKLFDQLDSSVVMVLVNAIYFQASWAKPFQSNNNEVKAQFKSNDDANSGATVTLMKQTDSFPYLDDPNIKARVLVLSYVKYEMVLAVFLPRDGVTLVDLETSLTSEMIDNAVSNAKNAQVSVALPKYSITSSLDLKDPIQKLGISKIFTGQADFGKITDSTVEVSQVVQKAIIEVSENGTIAAAATGAVISLTAVFNPPPPIDFRADHPFIYALYHQTTKSIIFIGRYTNASS